MILLDSFSLQIYDCGMLGESSASLIGSISLNAIEVGTVGDGGNVLMEACSLMDGNEKICGASVGKDGWPGFGRVIYS